MPTSPWLFTRTLQAVVQAANWAKQGPFLSQQRVSMVQNSKLDEPSAHLVDLQPASPSPRCLAMSPRPLSPQPPISSPLVPNSTPSPHRPGLRPLLRGERFPLDAYVELAVIIGARSKRHSSSDGGVHGDAVGAHIELLGRVDQQIGLLPMG